MSSSYLVDDACNRLMTVCIQFAAFSCPDSCHNKAIAMPIYHHRGCCKQQAVQIVRSSDEDELQKKVVSARY